MHPPYRQCLEPPIEWPAEPHPIKRTTSADAYQSLCLGQTDMAAGIKPYSHLTAAFKPIFSSTHVSFVLQGPAPNPASSIPKTKNCLAELQLPSRPEKPKSPMGALPHSALPFVVSHVASLQCKHTFTACSAPPASLLPLPSPGKEQR